MSDDIVAELDRWLAEVTSTTRFYKVWGRDRERVKRARDEIVALRKALHAEMMGRPDKWHQFLVEARAEQRERDARIAENACLVPPDGGSPTEDERLVGERAAAAIRNQGGET